MTAPSYHPCYIRVRRPIAEGFGFLAGWSIFKQLVAMGAQAPCDAFLVDAGDGLTEAAHERARQTQQPTEYTRQRLRLPRFSYTDESKMLRSTAANGGDTFLELVLGGGVMLRAWYLASRAEVGQRGPTSVNRDPMAIHCHTPLNQRLLPAHLRVCHLLVTALGPVRASVPTNTPPPLLAAGCFIVLADILGLNSDQRAELTSFGTSYLAHYLGYSATSGDMELARRRADRVDALAAQIATLDADQVSTSPAVAEAEGLFFPESLWAQWHWFAASLPLALSQELALSLALSVWTGGHSDRVDTSGLRR